MSNLIRQFPRHPARDTSAAVSILPSEEHIYIDEGESFDFRKYWQILLKHKWLVLAFLVTGVALAKLETSLTTPLFRSSTTVQIDPPGNVLPYQEIEAVHEGLQGDSTQVKILESRSLALRVVERLKLVDDARFNSPVQTGFINKIPGIYGSLKQIVLGVLVARGTSRPQLPPGDETSRAVTRLMENRSVEAVEESRIIRVTYRSPDPELSALVVNTLVDEYIERNFESKFEATTAATQFLQKQLLELKIQIEKAEENLVRYTRESEYIDFNRESDITMQKLGRLTEEMTRLETELISLQALYESVKDASSDSFPSSLRTEAIHSLETVRLGLQQKLASLSAQFGPDWPEVAQVKQELGEVTRQIDEELELTIDRVRTDYRTTRKRHQLLKDALNQERQTATNLHEASIQYNILKREVDSNKELYEGLLQRLKEAGISAGLKSSNIRVVDPGEAPASAYYPPRQRNLILGLMLGLFCGVGLAFLLEQLDNTIKTSEDAEASLGLPSLGMIPAIAGAQAGRGMPLLRSAVEDLRIPVLWEDEDPRSQSWEAYRSLRMSVLLSHSNLAPRVILVTSALPGEGKSTTAVNTACVLAQSGAPTLLVDLDLRRPCLAKTLGIDNDTGMSTFLSGQCELSSELRESGVPNLVFVPSGPVPPNPATLLDSQRLESGMALMRTSFEYVVIDSPPILSVTDPLMLARYVDGVLIVVKAGSTSAGAVRKASQQILRVDGKILGVVINNVDLSKSDYAYYYPNYLYQYHEYYSEERRKKAR